MTSAPTLESVIEQNRDLVESGASLHWLVPFEKRPIQDNWSQVPTHSLTTLRNSYRQNANIGIRLGEPSKVGHLYLHIVDLDIRKAELAGEAWVALLELLPDARELPSVISGSGGESRHIYFLTDKPFRKKKLLKSEGYSMVFDPRLNREVKKSDWEIDMMGTGSQAVIPPSIHPDTKKPYVWERELDLSMTGLGIGPIVPSSTVASWGVDESSHSDETDDDDLFAILAGSPLDLEEDEVDKIVAGLPADWVEDRDHWLTVGAALHHQFEGTREGFDKWCEWSKQSEKFNIKDTARVWKSFKGSKNPVRMATLIQASAANRMAEELDLEDDNDDPFDAPVPAVIPTDTSLEDLFDLTPLPNPAQAVRTFNIDPDWQHNLSRNEEGELKSTLPNVRLIVRNDKRMTGVMAYNEFLQDIVLKSPPGRVKKKRDKGKPVVNLESDIWQVRDELNGDNWIDTHDNYIRMVIESPTTQGGFGIKVSDRDLKAAIDICASENKFHPIRDMLESFQWDGKRRIETFFIDYLGTDDTPYYRQTAIMMLLGAVARVYEPGHKFDFVAILEGAQGAGKSTFIRTLGMDWYSELTGDIGDTNKMIEAMAGSWIIEIGELSSMHRSEVNDLKAFVSRTHDKGRLAYAKRSVVYPRKCIFIGSTNDGEYLRDSTGNRRYWPIVCNLEGRMIDNPKLAKEVHLIWAEAVQMYREMRKKTPIGDLPFYLSNKDAAAEAKVIQESKRMESAEDALASEILAWLDSPIVEGDGFVDPDGERPVHQVTCMNQIWKEVLGRSGSIPTNESMKIGKAMLILGWERSANKIVSPELGKKYGSVRVYYRPT
jgi:predicted P-loop ATPase